MLNNTYTVHYYREDECWVGTCDKYPSLSWCDLSPVEALEGIIELVDECEEDLRWDELSKQINSGITVNKEDWDKMKAVVDGPPKVNEKLQNLMNSKAPWEGWDCWF